ncbi:FAD-binding oxidoreductase [Nocardioides sp. R-C-SC26]|uniref:NAD(P)/FAD-dependent oxidoreductase n=1 Tax=Nocardioides sp. R-C-SC26 TaxID=2870414 RepID=UPI001E2B5A00|nr:FAD-dependent oxidoreductase [Nocardioides sp. R-C-SC26]
MAGSWAAEALTGARRRPYWLDTEEWPDAPERLDPLRGGLECDLAVVGGGYTGLWTALRAVERDPGRRVVLLEAGRCGDEASGRNGGFASASLTHGFGNGVQRWPEELDVLDRLGTANLDAIGETISRHGIDCRWERTGELTVATQPWQAAELAVLAEQMRAHGHEVDLLDETATRSAVHSPTYRAALREAQGTALVEPARLAWGLRQACLDSGVRIVEGTYVRDVVRAGDGVRVVADAGSARARQVVLATNAFRPLLRRLRSMTVPVYDYVLMSEPLTREQRAAVGWAGREGIGDAANQFHYYRLTRDDRILWGGYDAVYYAGSRIARSLEQSEETHGRLAAHFFETFPQLEGLRFSHRWGGVIDTCSRFAAFFGTAWQGRVAYALGYTGLGVAATRFGADVMLDLLHGEETERTALRMVRERPLPFPPEPVRSLGINLTRRSIARADEQGGRRDLWLRTLDRLGLGFDS